MKQTGETELLFKHYYNMRTLSIKQFEAIQEDQLLIVEELIAQKGIMITEIKKWYEQHVLSDYPSDVTAALSDIIREIRDYEEKSQQLLTERQEQVRKVMVVNQKSKLIQRAYEDQAFPQQLNIQK
ncbi:hypothetical protein Ga0466249_000239 [Sporomusaceae bacterium BoRhaA]|uniref:hypothetical protein n=1 Tax=Pelorhabdus rhamnosifermentans TaxID=2772457 RepID=UPI001C064549|nr:hypothetical protein [Pelorhabdus rhamnosifermentans]MBU2699160.1 hypothetical protein [Pelorhabdus rhamnosifermentans]